MHAVMLYLSTQTPERSMTELTEANETRTVQYVETYRFSKSVTDGGLAQMQRLLQFGRAVSHFTAPADDRPVSGRQFEIRRGDASPGSVRWLPCCASSRWVASTSPKPGRTIWWRRWVAGWCWRPWPNRVAGARWKLDGKIQQLDVTEPVARATRSTACCATPPTTWSSRPTTA